MTARFTDVTPEARGRRPSRGSARLNPHPLFQVAQRGWKGALLCPSSRRTPSGSAPPRPGLQGSAGIGKELRLESFPRKPLWPGPDNPGGLPPPTQQGPGLREATRRLRSNPSSGPSLARRAGGQGPMRGLRFLMSWCAEQTPDGSRAKPGAGSWHCGFWEEWAAAAGCARRARDKQEADENNSAGSWAVSAAWRRKRNRHPNRPLACGSHAGPAPCPSWIPHRPGLSPTPGRMAPACPASALACSVAAHGPQESSWGPSARSSQRLQLHALPTPVAPQNLFSQTHLWVMSLSLYS